MSKRSIQGQETMYSGIDVSAKSLIVAIQRVYQPFEQRSFPNTSIGHRALIVWLQKANHRFECRWKPREFTLWISRLHFMQRKESKSQS
ncbi:hypothetical protein HDF09_002299 [Edaphobacter lichenicola]|uniref:Uncharacterized protein n=1 Tax=Tunturiibacter empetritectus TaxID=3069691 RepID=A0A7W8II76_9BACT|nr:hypothetical protein [Edaphobacter lichenicola]